jgi:hypothetical protein
MESKPEEKNAKKGFFSRLIDKLDKKLQEKANSSSCCCNKSNDKGNKSCCS